MSKETKHICFFNSHKKWGGGEKWHMDAAQFLSAQHIRTSIYAHGAGELYNNVENSVPKVSVSLSNLSFLNPFAYAKLVRLFKKHGFNTIILCLPIDVKVAGVAAKIAGIKHIIYRRGSAIPIKNSCYNRFLFSKIITHIIANSEATKETILQHNSSLFPQEKITVLYNGIDISPVLQKTKHTVPIIAAAGRLEYQKNFECLIELAEILQKRNYSFIIKIAGEGSLWKKLDTEIRKKGLSKHIILVGFINNMNQFFAESDIFVLPSFWEGFGFVLAEAMAQELPLVAFNISSNKELIDNTKNGFLINDFNIEACADAICTLLDSENLRHSMGKAGREKVLSQFSIEKAHTELIHFIQRL
jgi:glycosyltransferase involved in cell wall biosynthesis